MQKLLLILFLSIFASASLAVDQQSATLIVFNADIWTGDTDKPTAQAMAISGNRFMAVGSNEEVLKLKNKSTKMVDAQGRFITPGFIDSHVHLLDGGFTLASVKLRDAKTPQEFVRRIEEYAKTVPEGTWIIGSDWDGSNWNKLPSKDWIDSVTPKHPVFLARFDGHIGLANSLAMKLAGIDQNTPDVEGGVILRDKNNLPTGIFKDNAMMLISSKIPTPSAAQFDNALDRAMNYFLANGVTSVHHVWYPTDYQGYLEGFERAWKNKRLKIRIYALDSLANWAQVRIRASNKDIDPNWLKLDGVKGVLDGALGSHTAAFLEPYTDDPSDIGSLMMSEKDLYEWTLAADKANIQVAIHAIGDKAIGVLLDAYEKISGINGPRDRRFRIEHVQHIAPKDISRFAQLGVIASMQPYHAIDDGRWAERVIGHTRAKTSYAWKSLIDTGAVVAFGSDWPVAPGSVIEGIYAATTRKTIDDRNPSVWIPEQRISVEQALKAYTINGAFASFEEKLKGSIEVGKLADFVILSNNLLKTPPEEIRKVHVIATWIDGKLAFEVGK